MKYVPHKYQEKAIQFMLERPCAGLFLSPGLGKTSISLTSFKILQKKKMVRAMLVLAPLRPCYMVWGQEKDKWDDFGKLKVEILHGTSKVEALKRDADIYVMNFEGLKWLSGELAKSKKPWPFDMLVVDESSKLKSPQTQRFKIIKPMLEKFSRRYILTGTPVPNGLIDIFGQMYVMDRGATFGPYITHFRSRYFYQTGFGGYEWKLKHGGEKEIQDAIAPRVLQMTAEDYLELPELIFNDIFVDLPPSARKLYKQMEDDFFLQVKDGTVVASNAAGASNKCRQIASGGVYSSDDEWEHIHDAKTEALEDLLEELSGSPALVMYAYRHDLDRIKKLVGKDMPFLGGGVTARQSVEIQALWNAGEIPVLAGHPQSMAHGLNLQQSGNTVIWYTLTWNFEEYDQAIRRIYRQGQKGKRVIVHRIIARDTLDEAVVKALERKGQGQTDLFNAITEYWKERGK